MLRLSFFLFVLLSFILPSQAEDTIDLDTVFSKISVELPEGFIQEKKPIAQSMIDAFSEAYTLMGISQAQREDLNISATMLVIKKIDQEKLNPFQIEITVPEDMAFKPEHLGLMVSANTPEVSCQLSSLYDLSKGSGQETIEPWNFAACEDRGLHNVYVVLVEVPSEE